MKIRVAAVAGLTLAGLITGQAGANTKTCNLLQDDKGDATFLGALPTDDSLDILSADIASDAKNLTGVIRLAGFTPTNPNALGGQNYYLQFTAPGGANPLWLSAAVDPTGGAKYSFGEYTTTAAGTGQYTALGTSTGVIDEATSEVRITVPLSGWAGKGDLKPGAALKSLEASSTARAGAPVVGGPGVVFTVDDAIGTRSYTAGGKSCVAVGK